MAALETGPVGTVRAIGEIVEVKFAYADAALGLYSRAARLLEAYANEGGSTNTERQAATGGQPNPAQDKELRGLYITVIDGLTRTSPPAERPALAQRRAKTLALYYKLSALPPDGYTERQKTHRRRKRPPRPGNGEQRRKRVSYLAPPLMGRRGLLS